MLLAGPADALLAAVAPFLTATLFLEAAPPFLAPAFLPFLAAAPPSLPLAFLRPPSVVPALLAPAFLRPPSVVPAFLAPAFLDAVAVAPRFPGAPVAVTGAAGLDCASDWPDRRVDDCPPPCLDCAPPCLDCALAAWRPFDEARDPLMRA